VRTKHFFYVITNLYNSPRDVILISWGLIDDFIINTTSEYAEALCLHFCLHDRRPIFCSLYHNQNGNGIDCVEGSSSRSTRWFSVRDNGVRSVRIQQYTFFRHIE